MSRRKTGKESVRNLQKSHGSYLVSIPIALVHALGWQERQKVTVKKYGKNKLVIADWVKKRKK